MRRKHKPVYYKDMSARFSREVLFQSHKDDFIIKGIRSASIIEKPVHTSFMGRECGLFQGVEICQRTPSGSFELTAVDLIANMFLRLTHLLDNENTGTLGSSFLGSFSFRDTDAYLHYTPYVERAEVSLEGEDVMRVSLIATFPECASVTSVRRYPLTLSSIGKGIEVITAFTPLVDLELHDGLVGSDALRIFTVSSMYANEIYDANLVSYENVGQTQDSLLLTPDSPRGAHLFTRSVPATSIAVLKTSGSAAPRGKPGAFDSPSLKVSIASSPGSIGVQAYLHNSLSVHDDSLSVWGELRDSASVLRRGETLTAKVLLSAFQYEGKKYS